MGCKDSAVPGCSRRSAESARFHGPRIGEPSQKRTGFVCSGRILWKRQIAPAPGNPCSRSGRVKTVDDFSLNLVQRWMQSVIVHPNGVAAGLAAEATQQYLSLPESTLQQLIPSSSTQTSVERLAVY